MEKELTGQEAGASRGDTGRDGARRARLRELYRRHGCEGGAEVDMASVRAAVEHIARATLQGWRAFAALDHVALADAGCREDFEELEFLVNRGLCELSGIKNVVALARRLA